ncbi:PAQR family membrane homeostasis protein TrhA [Aridibaculum aurantiacum]|uniref:PAQR family membrane homeostasis protein TrhA n=1 Tax=Aridibaculum aurantiacum TaxID=2810307 RepID=UPI001A970FD2|nr:hemolysin III family protein [Aridibaculum aurantiacum]
MAKHLPIASDCFTPEEELANTIIHAIGVLFGLVAIPFLIMLAAKNSDISNLMRVGIYGACFMATFVFSTLFHWFKEEKVKCKLEMCDRISIYFFIAGTYTPFILYYMYDRTGFIMLGIMWALVLFGIFFEIFLAKKYFIISLFIYLAMGWMFVFVLNKWFDSMPSSVITFILTGVGLYSIGVIFYVWKKYRYHHAVWHFFVLVASIFHYLAVLETVS